MLGGLNKFWNNLTDDRSNRVVDDRGSDSEEAMPEDSNRGRGQRSEKDDRREHTHKSKKRNTSEVREVSARSMPPSNYEEPAQKSRRHHSVARPSRRRDESTSRLANQRTPSQTEYIRQLEERAAAAEQALQDKRQRAADKEAILRRERESLERDVYALERENDNYALRIAELQERLQSAETEREEMRRLHHQSRSTITEAELQAAHRFLEVSDHLSEADVKEQIERLNEEIALFASSIAEGVPVEHVAPGARPASPEAVQYIESLVGPCVCQALQRSHANSGDHTTYLQIAVQIYLNHMLSLLSNSWDGNILVMSRDWETVYDKVKNHEGHAVASQWRAITRRSLQMDQGSRQQMILDLTKCIADDLAGVLNVARRGQENPGSADALLHTYEKRIASLISLAIRLNESMGFGVSSHDLAVDGCHPGLAYDERRMFDYWGKPGSRRSGRARGGSERDTIAGTCALGLIRRPDASAEASGPGGGAGLVLLPVGVVLCSTLQ